MPQRLFLRHHEKVLREEEQMMRIVMPNTSLNDLEPLAIFVNKPSTATKTLTFNLGDILREAL